MVGLGRFELPTSRLSSARSNQLSYRPRELVRIHEGKRNEDGGVPLCENQSEEFHSGGVFLKRSEDQDLS